MNERPGLAFTNGVLESDRLSDLVGAGGLALDPQVLAAHAIWALPNDPGGTVYRGIRCALLDRSSDEALRASSERAAITTLRRALEGGVKTAIGDAKRVAVLTGGGLDSGALLALSVHVGRRIGASVFAVALDFEARGDDRPYLAALERHLACEVVRVLPEDAARRIELLDGVDAAPLYCPTAPLEIELMTRAKAKGAEVVLMGTGGDQLFDGRPTSLAALARRGRVREAVRRARGLRGFPRPRSPVFSWVARPILVDALPAGVRTRRLRQAPTELPEWAGPTVRAFEREQRRARASLLESCLPDTRPLDRHLLAMQCMQAAWLRHQASIAAGIDRVDPYLSPALIDTITSFPREWLLAGGARRGLFREAVRDLLPDVLLSRTDKAAFEPALMRFLTAAGGAEGLRPYASVERLASLGIVEPASFRTAFEAFVRAPADAVAWTSVWCVLALERFARRR